MSLLYRLEEDNRWTGLKEGSCITEEKYKQVFYSDKCLYSPIQDFERKDMVEFNNDEYCREKGIETMLFYTQNELENFLKKI